MLRQIFSGDKDKANILIELEKCVMISNQMVRGAMHGYDIMN